MNPLGYSRQSWIYNQCQNSSSLHVATESRYQRYFQCFGLCKNLIGSIKGPSNIESQISFEILKVLLRTGVSGVVNKGFSSQQPCER